MSHKLSIRALLVSLVVLGAQLVVMTPAASAEAGSSDSTPVLLSGSLTDQSPLLTNDVNAPTVITARVWPKQETLVHMEPGESVDLAVLSSAKLDSQGAFTLTVPFSRSLDAYTNPDGTIDLNLEIHITGGTITVPVSTKVRAVAAADQSESQPGTDLSLATRQSVDSTDASADATTYTNYVTQTGSGTVQINLGAVAASGQGGCYPGIGIGHTTLLSTNPSWTIVGQSFSNTPNADAKWTYTTGQSSRLGITGTGSDGNWHANIGYTNVTTSSSTTGFGTQSGAGSYHYKSKFLVQKWSSLCQRNIDPTSTFTIYTMKPAGFYGGAWSQTASGAGNAHNCAWYSKSNWLELTRSTAITWTNGLSLSAFGLSIGPSARTGYSTKAKVRYTAQRGGIYLCGNNGGPASTTTYVVSAAKTSAGY